MSDTDSYYEAILASKIPFPETNIIMRVWIKTRDGDNQTQIALEENVCQATVSNILRRAKHIIIAQVRLDQKGEFRADITLKQNSHVMTVEDKTLLTALRNIAVKRRLDRESRNSLEDPED